MICPKCQKQKNEEVNIEFIPSIKSFQRKRKCKCGYIFTTYEHVAPDNMIIDKLDFKYAKSHTRKKETRTVWQDWRFLAYARVYFVKCFTEISKFLKKENLEQKFEDRIVILRIKRHVRGKILYRFIDTKSRKVYEFQGKDLKMRSIREILKKEQYWENRTHYLKKPYPPSEEDRKHEERQFINSLSHKKTGIRAKKYNIEFLRQDWALSKFIEAKVSKDPNDSKDFFWELWKEIR